MTVSEEDDDEEERGGTDWNDDIDKSSDELGRTGIEDGVREVCKPNFGLLDSIAGGRVEGGRGD